MRIKFPGLNILVSCLLAVAFAFVTQLTGPRTAEAAAAENKHAVAVIIGNKDYTGEIPEVQFADRDAEAMKRFVIDVLGYRSGNVIDLRNATGTQIEAVFGNKLTHEGKLYDWIRPEKSDVLIYYSGHGVPGLKDKSAYLLPVDGDANRAEITGYPVEVLYANLAKSRARSVTIYLDACFSGSSPKGMLVNAASGLSISAKLPSLPVNMTIITAAQGDQLASWDEDARHGLFTEHLLTALYGTADGGDHGNGDGTVTASEIKAYLDDEMTYQARRRYGRSQTASLSGSEEMVLANLDGGNPIARPAIKVETPAPAKSEVASLPPKPEALDHSGDWTLDFIATWCIRDFAEEDISVTIDGDKFKGSGNRVNISGKIISPTEISGAAWVSEGMARFKGKFSDGNWQGTWEGDEGCHGTFISTRK